MPAAVTVELRLPDRWRSWSDIRLRFGPRDFDGDTFRVYRCGSPTLGIPPRMRNHQGVPGYSHECAGDALDQGYPRNAAERTPHRAADGPEQPSQETSSLILTEPSRWCAVRVIHGSFSRPTNPRRPVWQSEYVAVQSGEVSAPILRTRCLLFSCVLFFNWALMAIGSLRFARWNGFSRAYRGLFLRGRFRARRGARLARAAIASECARRV